MNTAIFLKYVGQVNSSDKNTTKKFRQHLHNGIAASWQVSKYSREEKRDLKDRSRQNNLWRGFDEVENYTWEEQEDIITGPLVSTFIFQIKMFIRISFMHSHTHAHMHTRAHTRTRMHARTHIPKIKISENP